MNIEYYYCLVCSMRLPVTRRLQGTHEECEEFYRPKEANLKTHARKDIASQRRERVDYLIKTRMPLKRIALELGVAYTTIQNDARELREARKREQAKNPTVSSKGNRRASDRETRAAV